ncbi:hypothetical protein SAMN06298216_1715 [Spirosomataceae bacterium TFI 002]|nr:hypothetical protein SAMN06298216_1715 [Spirosomataceae bacterium TFI 002]
MKAKNYLSIRVKFEPKRLSINSAAKELVSILVGLSELDSLFLYPIVITGQKSELSLNLSEENKERQVSELANGILRAEWNEITQYEGDNNPTINYSREDGYPVLLRFEVKNDIVFWIGCRLGSNINQTFTIRGFSSNNLFEYSWYENVFKALVGLTKAEIGTVAISNESFGKFYNQMDIKYPIGWITYFSDSLRYCIPEDLKDTRCEFIEEGKFLYTSDQDFMKDKEAYFSNREKLERVINEIRDRVPEFVKKDNNPTA